jgi:hypothetical protein
VLPEERRQIKAYAALYGKTMREYVLECVQKRLREEVERKELSNISAYPDKDPILNSVWENKNGSFTIYPKKISECIDNVYYAKFCFICVVDIIFKPAHDFYIILPPSGLFKKTF